MLIFSGLLQVDIEEHCADSADRRACSCHIEVGEVEPKDLSEKRNGIHPERGDIVHKRTDIAQQGYEAHRCDNGIQSESQTFLHHGVQFSFLSVLISVLIFYSGIFSKFDII